MRDELNSIKYSQNSISKDKLFDFLLKIDNEFNPSLSEIIDISEYSEKLYSNANLFEAWDGDELVALVAMYANNKETKKAFITLVYCVETHRRQGITNNLLNLAFAYLKKISFNSVFLKCVLDNTPALNMYKKLGFDIESTDDKFSTKVIMTKVV